MVIRQYDILLINLEPAIVGVLLSPDEMNEALDTVIIAPASTKQRHNYPTRVEITLDGKSGQLFLDQIRTIEKRRIVRRLGALDSDTVRDVKNILALMLAE
jgi:mRNA interferase MazF